MGLFRLDLMVLGRLSRLWNNFWSDRADSEKGSAQTIQIIPQNYRGPRPRYYQIIQTLARAVIRFYRPQVVPWSDRADSGWGSDQTIQTVGSDARLCGVVAVYPRARPKSVWSELAWVAHLILGTRDYGRVGLIMRLHIKCVKFIMFHEVHNSE